MPKKIPGLELELDTSNPETPKIVNPVNGQGQRATYTDVLLVQLLEQMTELNERLGKPIEGVSLAELEVQTENPKEVAEFAISEISKQLEKMHRGRNEDDNETNRLLSAILEKLDIPIQVAVNGTDIEAQPDVPEDPPKTTTRKKSTSSKSGS